MAKKQEVKILITADGKRAVTGFNRVRGAMAKTKAGISSLTGSVGRLGLAFASAYGISKFIKSAMEFETKMSEISTLVDTSRVSMERYEEQIKTMAVSVGKGTSDLASGLYQVVSAGIDTAAAMDVLEVSAKAAVAGITDTKTSVDIITTTLNAYGMEASEATRVSDVLFTTVRLGKTTFGELGQSLGQVLPFTSQLGISIEEVGAAMATLTAAGLSTEIASTALRALTISFIKGVDKWKDAGVDIMDVLGDRGIKGAMEELQRVTGGSQVAMQKFIPETRALAAGLTLAGTGAEKFSDNLKEMANAIGASGIAYLKMASDAKFAVDVAKAQFDVLAASSGKTFLPTLTLIMNAVTFLLDKFVELGIRVGESAAYWRIALDTIMERIKLVIQSMWDWAKVAGNVGKIVWGALSFDWGMITEGWAGAAKAFDDSGKHFADAFRGGFVAGIKKDFADAKEMIEALEQTEPEIEKKGKEIGIKLAEVLDIKAVEKFADDFTKEIYGAYDTVEDKAVEMGRTTEDVFQQMRYDAGSTANNLVYSFENMFFDGFKSGLDGLLDYFKRFLGRLVSTALASRITVPVQTVLTGANGLFPLAGAGGSASGGGLSGWLSGLGGLTAGAGGYMIGSQFGGAGKWGGLAGGLGGYALGGLAAPWVAGGISSLLLGGAAGATAIGAQIGSIVPVIGTIIGAVLGGLLGSIFGGKDKIPSTELVYRPEDQYAEPGFWIKGEDKVGGEFASAVTKAMDATRDNLMDFMEAIGGDTSKFYEKFLTGSKNLDKEVDLEELFKKWAAQYTEFVTGIDFSEFQRKGEELSDTIDRIVSSVLAITKFENIDIVEMFDEIELAPKTLKESLDLITQDIYDAATDLKDLTGIEFGDKLSEIAGLITARYEAEIQYLVYIKSLADSIAQSIQQQIEGFELDLMTPQEKISKYKDTMASLFEELQEATDPQVIQDIVDQIQQAAGQWWNILTPEEQARSIDDITDFLNTVNELAQQKLSDAVNEQIDVVAELAQSLAEIDWSPLGYLTTAAEQAANALAGLGGVNFPEYAQGTSYVPQTGLAYVHQGERIIPAGSASGGPITIILEGDAGAIITKAKIEGSEYTINLLRKNPSLVSRR